MNQPFTQQNLYLTVSSPLGDDDLIVQAFHGEDRVSGLFHYQVELISEASDIDFSKLVGASMTLNITSGEESYPLNGVVARFVQAGTSQRFTTYYAELRPWLWLTTLVTDSCVFQEKSTPEIIEEIFKGLGYSDYKLTLQGTYPKREFCVQYQETCFDFVSRLMEDEGIFYYFEHEEGKHTLIIADAQDVHAPRGALTTAPVTTAQSSHGADEIITHLALEQQVVSTGYAMTDYNFEQPTTQLGITVGEAGPKARFEYPGGYIAKGDGEARIEKRIQALELPTKRVRGQSFCRGMLSGHTLEITDHVREDLNAEYVMRWVSHSGNQGRYSNSFEAFPSDVPFRPPRITRKPTIQGAQTAVVVGKSGEEIFTDKYGRVKVAFPWDRNAKKDETASCWIRVAQAWAGKGYGAMFIPRIGQEVLVSFLDGDPDRPIITGSVYNAEQTVPYALPGEQTKTTFKTNSAKGGGGSNELRFEDKKDAEEIYLHAQKDMLVEVENDVTRTVKNDETITITNARTTTIEKGDETLTVKEGNRIVKVEKGDETHEVKGKRTVKVSGAETRTHEDKVDHKVGGNFTLKVDGDLVIEAGGKITFKAGSSLAAQSGTSLTVKAGTALKGESGTDLALKAGTNLKGEAGVQLQLKGSAMGEVNGGGMLNLKGGMVKVN